MLGAMSECFWGGMSRSWVVGEAGKEGGRDSLDRVVEEDLAAVLLGPVWLAGQVDRWEGPTTSSPPPPQGLQGSLKDAQGRTRNSDSLTEE